MPRVVAAGSSSVRLPTSMPRPNKAARARRGDPLTARELEVLAWLAAGESTVEISARLSITSSTIKTHLTSVYKKIGTHNRVQAARYYLDHYAE
jgi:DNA-binding CsgD family transcriptional regulator